MMDEDMKLAERLNGWVAWLRDGVPLASEDDKSTAVMSEAAATITRLRAEIEALKSDVSDLVRAGSDEATI